MKTKVIAIGLIENKKDSTFLISQRFDPEFPAAHMKWDFLGGKIEPGESAKETIEREVFEESGVKVSVGELLPKVFSKVWREKWWSVILIVPTSVSAMNVKGASSLMPAGNSAVKPYLIILGTYSGCCQIA